MTTPEAAEGVAASRRLVAEWLELRATAAELERLGHPDLIDHHGRAWAWWKGDLYRHDGMAWPRDFIEDKRHGLPGDAARANPNRFCAICAPEDAA